MTQKTRVKNKILEIGYVDNFWAIQNYILRLGAIIHELRKDGMGLTGAFGKGLGKERMQWKNYYYTKERQPEQDKECCERLANKT